MSLTQTRCFRMHASAKVLQLLLEMFPDQQCRTNRYSHSAS